MANYFSDMGAGYDYMLAPGARLEVGPHGTLYETMGALGDLDDDVALALQDLKAVPLKKLQSLMNRINAISAEKRAKPKVMAMTRRILDEIARKSGHGVSWFEKNKKTVLIGGAVGVGVLVLVLAMK